MYVQRTWVWNYCCPWKFLVEHTTVSYCTIINGFIFRLAQWGCVNTGVISLVHGSNINIYHIACTSEKIQALSHVVE